MILQENHALRFVLDGLTQAISALRDNRLRTLLSVVGIMLGVGAVMVVASISKGGHYLIFNELETFGLKSVWISKAKEANPAHATRAGSGIDNSDYQAIRHGDCCPAVQNITPLVYARGRNQVVRVENNYSYANLIGVDADYLSINNDKVEIGRNFDNDEVTRRRNLSIIGYDIEHTLFDEPGSSIGKDIFYSGVKYTVIGVLKSKSRDFLASIGSAGQDSNTRILIPYTTMEKINGDKEIHGLQIQTSSLNDTNNAVAEVTSFLQLRHANRFQYKSQTMSQYIETANRILKGVSSIGVVAASVSLLVGGMGIMNIMSISVIERTREIGLRKAIGAGKGDILFQFLMEASFISTLGGVLGLGVGFATSYGLSMWTGFPLVPSWGSIVTALGVSMGVGLLSGFYPARRAASLKPVEALRYE